MSEELIYQILSIVEEIPCGKVSTYKQIAILAGRDNNARLVGKILSSADVYGKYPCHRVVNASGKLACNFTEQRRLLENEGITFKNNGNVNLKEHLWQGLN